MTHDTEAGEFEERWQSVNASARGPLSQSVDQSNRSDNSVNKTMPWIALMAILATAALVVSVMEHVIHRERYENLWDKYELVERETRLQRLEVDELRAALAAQGINPRHHSPTDKP